ncbi:pilus assembly protein PilE [Paracidovorax avenae]|uniref:type IV pilin protein n=1 Tax=Paracidovorax avenae TaxID=80867 RepID=UPI000D15EFC7|nr:MULTISPECIES: type IV pilin protein [Comamonadaceae]AVS62990.1 pilus assembly protein PilE [Paracidovorax avenae]MDA8450433.1 type IV pilin protein [Acidovorax sp. GBBC 3297]MDA8459893.1 type IV pilin protein [Acidovorax sp. GBBC 3333]MDA8464929.1 type IV pilin protein [Acidovorax sp. GBBC 3332]MDA8469948.1 type IV pilin protein [Acidovorax sp. GBBC 3299]
MTHHRSNRGFTLLELMIVVAVVGILAAVAYPSYNDSVLKGRRAQARTALAELMQQQERFLTQRNCYLGFSNSGGTATATANTACGIATSFTVPFKTYAGESLSSASYQLSATTCSSTLTLSDCVKVVASPVKSDPAVGDLSMTSTGVKSCTGTASSTNPKLCWP